MEQPEDIQDQAIRFPLHLHLTVLLIGLVVGIISTLLVF